jgi:hypothetical protein
VKVTLAIWLTSMPWALSSTIWARRQVTTDPELRRTIRSSRLPSWLVISRTWTRSATPPPSTTSMSRESCTHKRQRAASYFNQTGPTLPDAALGLLFTLGRAGAADEPARVDNHGHRRTAKSRGRPGPERTTTDNTKAASTYAVDDYGR